MNIFLWILQVALAFLYLAGGGFKTFNPDDVASQITALPPMGWRVLGVFEVLGAILLIVPAATKWMPMLTPPPRSRSKPWASPCCTRRTH